MVSSVLEMGMYLRNQQKKDYVNFDCSVIKRKRVSVLIPAYNAEKYILETLQSVENQSFLPFEVIVLNDASTDRTCDVVRKFKKANVNLNVRLFNSPQNRGIGGTRQELVNLAKGNYFAFLSSDDVWHKHFLDICMMNTRGDRGVYSDYWFTDSNLTVLSRYRSAKFSKANVVNFGVLKNLFINFSCCVFPRSFFVDNPFVRCLRHSEDLIFMLDCMIRDFEFVRVATPLLYYRLHPSQGTNLKDLPEFYMQYRYLVDRLLKLGVSLAEVDNAYKSIYCNKFPSVGFRVKRKSKNLIKQYVPYGSCLK